MKRKPLLIVSIAGILLLLVVFIGFTYAYLGTIIEGNPEETSVDVFIGDSVIQFNDYSKKDTVEMIEPGYSNIKLFSVKNVNNLSSNYNIYLSDVENTFTRKNDLIYTLYRKEGINTINSSDLSDCEIVSKGIFPTTNMYIKSGEVLENKNDSYTYALKVEYINSLENQDINRGGVFGSKVQIVGDIDNTFESNTLAYKILKSSFKLTDEEESNGFAIFNAISDTLVNNDISDNDERVLSITNDEKGVSYYFRGNVKNNYALYDGKCFRIVRINGDGSIKLILSSNSSCETESNDMNLSLDNLDKSLLVNGYICNGDNEYLYDENGTLIEDKLSTNIYYYNSYKKINIDKLPSYFCNGELEENYISSLTLDEVILAGGYLNKVNDSFYLNNGNNWSLSTLSNNQDENDYVYNVSNNGSIDTISIDNINIRPVINIKSNILYTTGDGTKNNPYIIK